MKNEEQEKRYKDEQDQIQHMKEYVVRFDRYRQDGKTGSIKEKTLEKMSRSGSDSRYKEKSWISVQ